MLGSGSDPSGSQPLGSKIKAEVESALKLLFKSVPQHSISTELQTGMVVYLTDLPCETTQVPLQAEAPAVSSDPIQALRQKSHQVHQFDLLPQQAALAEACPCDLDPVLCHEPVLDEIILEISSVSFENMGAVISQKWNLETLESQSHAQLIGTFEKPETTLVSPQTFQPKTKNLYEAMPKFRTTNDPRFYALPIKKSPIPPHRFSAPMREAFRKALAEKANTRPDNVQLRIIFERMDMTLFASIQQDEQGNLLCTPKNELLGRNQSQNKNSAAGNNMYLVYGFRLDNKEDIRVVVPADAIKPKQMNYKRKS